MVDKTKTFIIAANTGKERTGTITFILGDLPATTVTVKQLAGGEISSNEIAGEDPWTVAKSLGLGWNLGNQLDAHNSGVANETAWGNKLVQNIRNFKFCYFIFCIMICLLVLSVPTFAKENSDNVIRVGSFEETYNVVNEKGERSGYGYEYLQDIAGYAGWTYKYITSDWKNCFTQLENGEIDILGGISYTDERAENMLFSDMPPRILIFSIFQLCKAVFPITCYVFICPSCITCNILKILITIAASFSLFIDYIISFLKRYLPG